ncbi:MAG: hypothetical protein CEE42_13360 [Promethearchaeota archaeon Loki_b31]|nr:MAG: hypothetical protein CEE42_13360 [Candidatus Lokiarchaeota archaeon Loki_b31]
MQLLNNGIKADLQKYREKRFDAERRELRSLRNWVNSIQKLIKDGLDFSLLLKVIGNPPKVKSDHDSSSKCAKLTSRVMDLLKVTAPDQFFRELQEVIKELEGSGDPEFNFSDALLKVMPKKRFTEKGMLRVKKELLKKLKTFFLELRKPIDDESIKFYYDSHVIFFQPENVTLKRKEKLASLLTCHSELKKYREMTLLVGEISRLPPGEINGHQIKDLKEDHTHSKKLNAAIRTIKKHEDDILRFVEFFKQNPGLSKAQHSNMEFHNKKFKEPFESGNNLLKKERVLGRLNTQLSGKVEWFLDNEVVT